MKWLNVQLKKYIFLIVFVIAFAASDAALARRMPDYIIESGRFWLNDFELTQRDNPQEVWEKVFFGNSTVKAAYRQELSKSGYVNLGMANAVLTDLWQMLRKEEIAIGSELVLGINWLTLYDDFETNPGYAWHRKTLEPYCYFQRNRLSMMLVDRVKEIALGIPISDDKKEQTKTRLQSALSEQELIEKAEDFRQRLWNAPPDAFENNYEALQKIIEYCNEEGIRIRVLIMPWNPRVSIPELVQQVMDSASAICMDNGVEVYDMTDALDPECFFDIAHLNYEYGSHSFTKEVDKWLNL